MPPTAVTALAKGPVTKPAHPCQSASVHARTGTAGACAEKARAAKWNAASMCSYACSDVCSESQ